MAVKNFKPLGSQVDLTNQDDLATPATDPSIRMPDPAQSDTTPGVEDGQSKPEADTPQAPKAPAQQPDGGLPYGSFNAQTGAAYTPPPPSFPGSIAERSSRFTLARNHVTDTVPAKIFSTNADATPESAVLNLKYYNYWQKMTMNPGLPLDTSDPTLGQLNDSIQAYRDAMTQVSQPLAMPPSLQAQHQAIFDRAYAPVEAKPAATYQDLSPAARTFTLARAIASLLHGGNIGDTALDADSALQWAQKNVVDPKYAAYMQTHIEGQDRAKQENADLSKMEGYNWDTYWQKMANQQKDKGDLEQGRDAEGKVLVGAAGKEFDAEQDQAMQELKNKSKDPVVQGLLKKWQSANDNNADYSEKADIQDAISVALANKGDEQGAAIYHDMAMKTRMGGPTSKQKNRDADVKVKNTITGANDALANLRTVQAKQLPRQVDIALQKLQIDKDTSAAMVKNINSLITTRAGTLEHQNAELQLKQSLATFMQGKAIRTDAFRQAYDYLNTLQSSYAARLKAGADPDADDMKALESNISAAQQSLNASRQSSAMLESVMRYINGDQSASQIRMPDGSTIDLGGVLDEMGQGEGISRPLTISPDKVNGLIGGGRYTGAK